LDPFQEEGSPGGSSGGQILAYPLRRGLRMDPGVSKRGFQNDDPGGHDSERGAKFVHLESCHSEMSRFDGSDRFETIEQI